MPTWKISGYQFYFKSSEPLKENDEIKVKKVKGRVSDKEKNEIKLIVRKNKRLFLEEWSRRKVIKSIYRN